MKRLVLGLWAACLVGGCSGGGGLDAGTGGGGGFDAGTGGGGGAQQARLALSPSAVDFGAVPSGSPSEVRTFDVTNEGGSATGPLELVVSPSAFERVTDGCATQVLQPSARCAFSVRFVPQGEGPAQGVVTVSASPGGTATASLTGIGSVPVLHRIDVAIEGPGVVSGPGLDCPTDCTESLPHGTVLGLGAAPSTGATFGGWSGCDSVDLFGLCTVTLVADTTIRAVFSPPPVTHPLTLTIAGTGSGAVTGSGIACPGDCAETFNQGVTLTLEATADPGSLFAAWTGCDATSAEFCTVTMNAPRAVTATFLATAGTNTLVVLKAGAGSGRVCGFGIDCGVDCVHLYTAGANVTLYALADAGSAFVGWTGCSGTGASCSFSMQGSRTVVARFEPGPSAMLTVNRTGAGAGTVTSNLPGINCGADCTEAYSLGQQVTLTATAGAGSTFGGWTGCDSSAGASCAVAMTADRTVAASFGVAVGHQLTVATAGSGVGTVTSSPAGISCGTDCAEVYAAGTRVDLTAAAAPGSVFGSWAGCDWAVREVCTVTVTSARTATITFNATGTQTFFPGGTLSDLRALNPNLTFRDLIFAGALRLQPADGSAVTIIADNITLGPGGYITFEQTDCNYAAPPSVTLRATGTIRLDGGGINLAGKGGSDTSSSSSCYQCGGVRGGNLTLQAASVLVAETTQAYIHVNGGNGARNYVGSGVYAGCPGGAGGTLTLSGSAAVTVGARTELDVRGGIGGVGLGGGGNGPDGATGTTAFTGAVAVLHEHRFSNGVEANALVQNVLPLTYQRFDVRGTVNLADDNAQRGQTGQVIINYPSTNDFCEDLFVLVVTAPTTLRLTLSSPGPGDLDLHLVSRSLTQLLASSSGATPNEAITWAAPVGTYVACVTWSDGNTIAGAPQAYTLAVGQ